jgi:DNA-binding NarL/FixJ family response regulator
MSAHSRIRVLLVDHHTLFRRGLATLLCAEPDIAVVGEAVNGVEAVAKAVALRPDVILMEVRMPRATGPEATRQIREVLPETKIIMLTVSELEDGLIDAVQSGAQGYLLKTIEPSALVAALRGVMRGEAVLSHGAAATLMREFACQTERPPAPPRSGLSRREEEIMTFVAEGKSNKEIATALGLAENTIKNHLKRILATLHLKNRVQVAVFAVGTTDVPSATRMAARPAPGPADRYAPPE